MIEIATPEEWRSKLTEAKDSGKTILVDFSASWCQPCHLISPVFEELSSKHPDLIFLKVDVDNVEEVASECAISAMPTFQVWKNGEKVDELVGAAKDNLKALVQKYA